MPVIIEALFIKLVFIIIIVSGADAVAEISINRIVCVPASKLSCLAPEDIIIRSYINIFENFIPDPELVCTFKINLPAVVISNKSCLIYILTKIVSYIIVPYMVMVNIIFLANRTYQALCDHKSPGALATNCPVRYHVLPRFRL